LHDFYRLYFICFIIPFFGCFFNMLDVNF